MLKELSLVCFFFLLISGQQTTEEASEVTSNAPTASTSKPTGSTVASATTAAPCADTITDCQKYLAQCSDPNYQIIMYQKCRKTCNLCNACLDTDDRCKKWASNGFCTNPFYQNIWNECRKSCGFCT